MSLLPTDYKSVAPDLTAKWAGMEVTSQKADIDVMARRIIKGKETYLKVQAKTSVPWWVIGLLHFRESGCSFTKHLHNGDSLKRRTVRVPAGRPPGPVPAGGFDWVTSACDALRYQKLDKVNVWTVERVGYYAMLYNGTGYAMYGRTNPYLWGGTNGYTKGKYVRDHVYDPNVVDQQVGVMPVMKRLSELDASFALLSDGNKRSVFQTIKRSPSLKAKSNGLVGMVVAFFAAVWEWIAQEFDAVVQWIERAVGVLPDATQKAQTLVGNAEGFTSAIHVPWPTIAGLGLGIVCLIYAICREVPKKAVQ